MKFAWTGDVPWRALRRGLAVQARPFRRAWTRDRLWRAVEGRCAVQANFINAGTDVRACVSRLGEIESRGGGISEGIA